METRAPEARLEEAVGLARAISLQVIHSEARGLAKFNPSTLFGSGAVDRLKGLVAGYEIEIVVVDGTLSPIQQRNLERAWKCKVIDRTGLILEIFGARARTREGVMQVELAALNYQRSRLVRSWTHLERQRGGFGFMGGPGETQIETDRRLIGQRITRLKKDLKEVKRTRALHRDARRRVPHAVIALVGYTNAGKSTLFNRLTRAEVAAKDQLFATLDPTMRGLELPSGRTAILSDTVGFISDLPHELVTAFHATLEEVIEADLVLHVRDAAHADTEAQKEDALAVLKQLGIDGSANGTLIEVHNKTDLMTPEARESLLNRAARSDRPVVPVSAATGEGCDGLLAVLDQRLAENASEFDFDVALENGKALAWLYRHGEVTERTDDDHHAHLKVRLDPADGAKFKKQFE